MVFLTDLEKDTSFYRHMNITDGHFLYKLPPEAVPKLVLLLLTKRLLKDDKLLLFLCTLPFLQVFLWRKYTFLAQDVIPLCVFIWVLEQNKK